MKEIWKDVVNYKGLYQVSNLGRVKSLKFGKERILRPAYNTYGYLFVTLCKDGKVKIYLVHRLVAQTFIPNPLNLPQVNHINEIKDDNRVENLEWCTAQYNTEYSQGKAVLQLTLDGQLVREWPSTHEAERQGGFGHGTISKACCNGKHNTHKGYKWKFKETA